MTDTPKIERNLCFGHVSELTFTVTKEALAYFEQKLHDATPEHQDVYDYAFGRLAHVLGTKQTECNIRRESFLQQQRRNGADTDAAITSWNSLCWEFTR